MPSSPSQATSPLVAGWRRAHPRPLDLAFMRKAQSRDSGALSHFAIRLSESLVQIMTPLWNTPLQPWQGPELFEVMPKVLKALRPIIKGTWPNEKCAEVSDCPGAGLSVGEVLIRPQLIALGRHPLELGLHQIETVGLGIEIMNAYLRGDDVRMNRMLDRGCRKALKQLKAVRVKAARELDVIGGA
jgi:hypothetical protein